MRTIDEVRDLVQFTLNLRILYTKDVDTPTYSALSEIARRGMHIEKLLAAIPESPAIVDDFKAAAPALREACSTSSPAVLSVAAVAWWLEWRLGTGKNPPGPVEAR